MQFLLLSNPDDSLFDAALVERALRSCPQFTDFYSNDIDLIDCAYNEPDDWTRIRFGDDRETITVDGFRDASLRAVLLIQKALGQPLCLFDDGGTFMLTFSDIETLEELEAAIDKARLY
jgi:hypothetical protein